MMLLSEKLEQLEHSEWESYGDPKPNSASSNSGHEGACCATP